MSSSNNEQRSSEVCNRAVVVSIRKFQAGVELDARQGVSNDNLKLKRAMEKLGFKAEFHEDLTARQIYSLFEAGVFSLQMCRWCLRCCIWCLQVLHIQEFSL